MQHQLLAQYINNAHTANDRAEYSIAVGWCKQALQLTSDLPQAWYNLSVALDGLGKRPEAIDALKRARILTLNSADAQNSIGLQFIELGAYLEAEQCLNQSIELAPDYAFPYSNLGKLREKQKRLEDAAALFRKAIELQPNLALVHANLGGILNTQKDYGAAEAACRKAIELDAKSPEAWSNIGGALVGLKRYEAAEAACRKAVELDANSPEAWSNLGHALVGLKRYEAAAGCFSKSLKLNADTEFLFGDLLYTKMKICDWRSLVNDLSQLVQKIDQGNKAANPFTVLGLTTDLVVQRKVAEIWVKSKCPEQLDLGPIPKRSRHSKIRIGYYSADFRNHPVSYLMAEIFELHDRNQFELIGFSFGKDTQDEMRRRVRAAFDTFIDVQEKSDMEIAELSRSLEIDIAIDLGGFTEDSRTNIFAMRAAPIQVSYIGYLGTMGAPYIDYLLADKTIIPQEHQKHYTEKIAYIQSYQANDSKRHISDTTFTREELGLPKTGFVFCCFNNNYKITPSVFGSWMRILQQVEGSVLFLYSDNDVAATNLRKEATKRGIVVDRLVFGGRLVQPEYLARYRVANLFLDTLPYNAGATASDALWAGLPVLTCIGEAFASRVASSLLNAVGLPELITSTQEEYEALAVQLATNPKKLAHINQKLERNRLMMPLFDTLFFTKQVEAAYTAMYERYQNDLPPEHIYVNQ